MINKNKIIEKYLKYPKFLWPLILACTIVAGALDFYVLDRSGGLSGYMSRAAENDNFRQRNVLVFTTLNGVVWLIYFLHNKRD